MSAGSSPRATNASRAASFELCRPAQSFLSKQTIDLDECTSSMAASLVSENDAQAEGLHWCCAALASAEDGQSCCRLEQAELSLIKRDNTVDNSNDQIYR